MSMCVGMTVVENFIFLSLELSSFSWLWRWGKLSPRHFSAFVWMCPFFPRHIAQMRLLWHTSRVWNIGRHLQGNSSSRKKSSFTQVSLSIFFFGENSWSCHTTHRADREEGNLIFKITRLKDINHPQRTWFIFIIKSLCRIWIFHFSSLSSCSLAWEEERQRQVNHFQKTLTDDCAVQEDELCVCGKKRKERRAENPFDWWRNSCL